MKRANMIGITLLTLVSGVLTSQWSLTAPSPKRAETQAFMRQKLAWSQAALEGLTLEKYDVVSKNSLRIRNMTQSNHWAVIQHPGYLTLTANFHRNADALYLAAQDKNLEAATDAYLKLTRNCIECHRLFRLEQLKQAASQSGKNRTVVASLAIGRSSANLGNALYAPELPVMHPAWSRQRRTSSSLVCEKSRYHWPTPEKSSGIRTTMISSTSSLISCTVEGAATGTATTMRLAPSSRRAWTAARMVEPVAIPSSTRMTV
jgi:hypothetical protein